MVSKAGLTVRFSEDDARAMGRDTSGVRGMDVSGDNAVIAMDIARDDQYLLVVTENGFGKRTLVGDYRKTSRGAKGVKTIQQTEAKGALAAALVVRDHHQLVFISQNGMIQRIGVRDLRPLGRNAQGFRLMNVREDDLVSAVALVMESEASDAVADEGAVSLHASGVTDEPALEGDGVFIGDPDAEGLLSVPEVESDEMPDSDVEPDEE
jgi:DNA gyrase subunit A